MHAGGEPWRQMRITDCFENTTDIVLRVQLDGVIEWVWPPVIQEVLGFSPERWVGRSTLDFGSPAGLWEELATQMQRVAADR